MSIIFSRKEVIRHKSAMCSIAWLIKVRVHPMWNFNKPPAALQLCCCFPSNLTPSVSMASQQHCLQFHESAALYCLMVFCPLLIVESEKDRVSAEGGQRRGELIQGCSDIRLIWKLWVTLYIRTYKWSQKKPREYCLCHSAAFFSCHFFPQPVYLSIHWPTKWTFICVCVCVIKTN